MFFAVDSVVLALRALSYVAIFEAAGGALFVDRFGASLSSATDESVRNRARIAGVLALCLSVASYVLTPARMAGSFGATFDPSLDALLLESNTGVANVVRIVGLAILFLSLDRPNRANTIALRAGVALTIASFALMGHTAIHPLRWLLAPLLLVHVAVVAFWFGALGPLAATVAREPVERSARVVARFSRLASRLVPLILVCGAALTVIFIRSFAELMTAYGAVVIGKTLAFAGLLSLAALNKWRYGPRLASGDPGAARSLRRTAAVEWAAIAAVLVATALMTALLAPGHLEGSFEHLDEHDGAPANVSPAGPSATAAPRPPSQ